MTFQQTHKWDPALLMDEGVADIIGLGDDDNYGSHHGSYYSKWREEAGMVRAHKYHPPKASWTDELTKQIIKGEVFAITSAGHRSLSAQYLHYLEAGRFERLEKQIEELRLQLETFKRLFGFGEYREIEASHDDLEARYRKTYPNSYLAIDMKTGEVLVAASDKKTFIQQLGKYSKNENLMITDTFDEIYR